MSIIASLIHQVKPFAKHHWGENERQGQGSINRVAPLQVLRSAYNLTDMARRYAPAGVSKPTTGAHKSENSPQVLRLTIHTRQVDGVLPPCEACMYRRAGLH